MTDAAVFTGTIGRVSTVPSRGVVLVTVEAPLEHHALVARIATHGQHVAVAAIEAPPEVATAKEKKRWNDLSPQAQAGTLCNDPEFIEYLGAVNSEGAAILVRQRCNVSSRSELSTNSRASRAWAEIVTEFRTYQAAKP